MGSADAMASKELRGTTIGVQSLASGATTVLKRIFKKNGLEYPSDYKLLAIGGGNLNLAALEGLTWNSAKGSGSLDRRKYLLVSYLSIREALQSVEHLQVENQPRGQKQRDSYHNTSGS
jgi:hypothetical protein